MPGLAAASYPGGGFQTSISGSPGASLQGPGGMGDMGWLAELAKRRAAQSLQQAGLQNKMLEQQVEANRVAARDARLPKLASQAPSQYGQMMGAARSQADASTLLGNQKIRDMMQAKSQVYDPLSTLAMRGAGSGILGAEQQYGQLPIAASTTGVQLPQVTGWDRYAQIAGAGGGASGAAVENMRNQAGPEMGGMDQYLNSLRMHNPALFRQLVAGQQK